MANSLKGISETGVLYFTNNSAI